MMFTEDTWIMMEIGDDDDEDLTLVKVMTVMKDVCDKDNDLTLIAPQSPGSVLCGERNSSF